MKIKEIIAIFVLTFTAACATGYQPKGFSGGYSETQLSENVFQVRFSGNGVTSKEQAHDFALLRAAELTLNHGYEYFVPTKESHNNEVSYHQTPLRAHTTSNINNYGSINNFGTYSGSTYGTSTTTFSGGETYAISRPESAITIICHKKKVNENALKADFIRTNLQKKYQLDLAATAEKIDNPIN